MKYLLFFFILYIFTSCSFLSGDKDLGKGYVLFENRSFTCIVKSSTDTYAGVGAEVIPPTVINVDYDDKTIIALSIDIETKKRMFWIIDKMNVPNMHSEGEWDSIKWQNVTKYIDSTSFYQSLKTKKIDLDFN